MRRTLYALLTALLILAILAPSTRAQEVTPAFSKDPDLEAGYRDLYERQFVEARSTFTKWISQHPDEAFGHVSLAASYLFEELFVQGVLTSEYFLDDKRFVGGITGAPDPDRIRNFNAEIAKARSLAQQRIKKNSHDPEGLYVMTLVAGMESNANSMLLKKHIDALKFLKEANANATTLLAQRPDAYDAFVALGSANYIIGSLSGSARFFLWFGGIHGDKVLGMEQVTKTAENGHYLKPFAKILLSLSARREKQDAIAQKYLKELSEEFPNNPLYSAEYAKALGRPIPATLGPGSN
jgi:hypothetical protein